MKSDVLEIEIGESDPLFARAIGPFGKCDADFFMRCPQGLKGEFALKAAKLGQSLAWRSQMLMAIDAYGVEHVVSLIAETAPVAGAAAYVYARAMVDDMLASFLPIAPQQRTQEHARRVTDQVAG